MSAPPARTACGSMPLTVAWVPTGMKAGVATRPWGVVISPQRAAPSVAIRRNWKASDIGTAQFWQGILYLLGRSLGERAPALMKDRESAHMLVYARNSKQASP